MGGESAAVVGTEVDQESERGVAERKGEHLEDVVEACH